MELMCGHVYAVRLCSGELRRWRFDGVDGGGLAWWRDEESGLGFSEASLMYAWEIAAAEGAGEAHGEGAYGGGAHGGEGERE